MVAAQISQRLNNALAVGAIDENKRLVLRRQKRTEHGFHGKRSRSLDRHTIEVVSASRDLQEFAAELCRQRLEVVIPRAPVIEHC